MKIGELARATGLSASGIRFYEEEGVIPRAVRQANGYRDYPESTLASLKLIQLAQEFGFSLKEIRSLVPADGGGGMAHCPKVLDNLKQKLQEVDKQLLAMSAARQRLVEAIAMFGQPYVPEDQRLQNRNGDR